MERSEGEHYSKACLVFSNIFLSCFIMFASFSSSSCTLEIWALMGVDLIISNIFIHPYNVFINYISSIAETNPE